MKNNCLTPGVPVHTRVQVGEVLLVYKNYSLLATDWINSAKSFLEACEVSYTEIDCDDPSIVGTTRLCANPIQTSIANLEPSPVLVALSGYPEANSLWTNDNIARNLSKNCGKSV